MTYVEARKLLLLGVLGIVILSLVLATMSRYELVAQHVSVGGGSAQEAYGGVYRLDRWTGRVTRISGPGQKFYDLAMDQLLSDARGREEQP